MIPPVVPMANLPVTLVLDPEETNADEVFRQICCANPELRIERTRQGEIIIMAPAGGVSSSRNSVLTEVIRGWSRRDGTGIVFDSSVGYVLPNSAIRSPDVSWVRRERLAALTPSEKAGFLPLCPDLVVELRSASDRLRPLQAKMEEYIANGARLGWLIDPTNQTVHVYRPGQDVAILTSPDTVSGDPELPGFVLTLAEVWDPGF